MFSPSTDLQSCQTKMVAPMVSRGRRNARVTRWVACAHTRHVRVSGDRVDGCDAKRMYRRQWA
jgi:hypothetical protein